MAMHPPTSGRATYDVEVSGSWTNPTTHQASQRTERFRVLALRPEAAMTAGCQLYDAAAAAHRHVAGERTARVEAT